MRTYLTLLAILTSLQFASAQLAIGPQGMSVQPGTTLSVDGLNLTPATSLNLTNNLIQKSSTPVGGSTQSISRVYSFSATIPFSGTASIHYLTSELNDNTESGLQIVYRPEDGASYTTSTNSSVDATNHYVSSSFTNQNLFTLTAASKQLFPDLTPILYTTPNTLTGSTQVAVVVDVLELLGASTSGTITVMLSQDAMLPLSFDNTLTSVGTHEVNNSQWTLQPAGTNPGYYTLTTTTSIGASDQLTFGLSGTLDPDNTTGHMSVTVMVDGGSGGEQNDLNNSDVEKIDYFQQ